MTTPNPENAIGAQSPAADDVVDSLWRAAVQRYISVLPTVELDRLLADANQPRTLAALDPGDVAVRINEVNAAVGNKVQRLLAVPTNPDGSVADPLTAATMQDLVNSNPDPAAVNRALTAGAVQGITVSAMTDANGVVVWTNGDGTHAIGDRLE
jgi:hypothetical protein